MVVIFSCMYHTHAARLTIDVPDNAEEMAEVPELEAAQPSNERRCVSSRRNFERFSANERARLPSSNTTTVLSATSSTLVQMWGADKAFKNGMEFDCAWTRDGTVDSAPLAAVAAARLQGNPCLATARRWLAGADALSAEEQAMTIFRVMEAILSHECDEEEAEEDSEEQQAALTAAVAEDELLDPVDVVEELSAETEDLVGELVECTLEGSGDVARVDTALSDVAGVTAALLVFGLTCAAMTPVLIMVVGAVLCVTKWTAKHLLGEADPDVSGCMGWWSTHTLAYLRSSEAVSGTCSLIGILG